MAHPFTRVVFRVGDDDARKLAEGFSFFEAQDFKNLEAGEAIARVERSTFGFNLAVSLPEHLDEAETEQRRCEVITASRKRYGTPRADIEAMLRDVWDEEGQLPKARPQEPPSILQAAPPQAPALPPSPTASESQVPEPSKETVPKVGVVEVPSAASLRTSVLASSPVAQPPPAEEQDAEKPVSEAKVSELAPSAKPQALKLVAKKAVRREPSPKELGKGGAQHTAIQKRIKEAAQSAGYLCSIETQLGNQQSVDVTLERGNQKIACEISITTTVDHEVQNVKKCLDSGFSRVAVICVQETRLNKIKEAVAGSLGEDAIDRVGFFLPNEFILALTTSEAPKAASRIVRGYKVTRQIARVSANERMEKEEAAVRLIAETIKRKK